ncbi:MAG: hypothetical protein F2537_03050 [Actinobacteria bacterium]|uniref:Unannotated protein n=1 Tax=freshwater metagenome TaxID=449393 RepID=A0A6J6CAJ1_9ZZZZ|nr:hypothetical protein [Actinomycetota bacterium]
MSEVSELKLNLITAISSSDQEEIVASLLYSQGCNIIYRAITLDGLTKFLSELKTLVSVLYSKEFGSQAELTKLIKVFKQHNFIEIDDRFDPLSLISNLAGITRPALLQQLVRLDNLVTVIGSPDSPGISTITNHLAIELSASLITSNHHNLRPLGLSKVNQIPASELGKTLEEFGKDQLIIDGGSTTSLTKILADRRVNAQWLSQSISCSRYLVYIVKSGDNGMIYLSEFISDFNNLINAPMLICVLNQQRFDRYGQVIQKRFNDLASSYPMFALPYDIGAIRAMNSPQSKFKFWRNSAFSNQIAKIGNHLK